MNDTRKVVIKSLEVLAREYPEQRIGQIIYNYILTECPNQDPFFISDKQLLDILEKEIEKFSH